MSLDDEFIFDNVNKLDREKAIEILFSILLTSDKWELRSKAIEYLCQYEDNTHFTEIKSMYLNESHSKPKIKLIELISKCYEKEGFSFLIPDYKNEKDWKVRKKIIESAGIKNETVVIPFFIEALGDPNVEVKKSAIVSLGNIVAVEALDQLINNLQYRIEEIYDILINTIVKIGKKTDIDIIIKKINTDNLNIKKSIPIILGKIQDSKAIDALIKLLDDENPIVRKNSILGLEKIIRPSDKNFNCIINMLNDKDYDVKKATIKILGSIGSKKAIKPLIILLKDKNKQVRDYSVKALDKILIKSNAFDAIYDLLKQRSTIARREAIRLLSAAKNDPNALNIALKLLNSKDSRIRRLAYNAILKILENKVDKKIIQGLKAKEWQVRKFCAKILGKIKDKNTIDLLLDLLMDSKAGVRKAASNALAKIDSTEVIEKISPYLKDPNWKTRRSAVNVFIKIGTDETLQHLIGCLDDNDSYIQSWAAKSLGKLKSIKNIQPLINLLDHADIKIRLSAIKALAEIGDKNAIEPLIKSLGADDWNERNEIENALQRIDPEWMKYL